MLENYQSMDINILVSIVNMKLRNEHQPLEDFCKRYQLEMMRLLQRLEQNGFFYDAQQSQFKRTNIQ